MRNNCNILFYALVLFFCFNGAYSQADTIYVDENYNKLSKDTFHHKLKSKAYDGYRHSTDTLILEILKPKYIFGNLEENIKSQLFKLLTAHHNIDTTKTLSIFYIDSLKAKKDFPKRNYVLVQDQFGNVIGKEKFRSAWIFPAEYVDVRKYLKNKSKDEVKLRTEYNYKTFLKNCKQFYSLHEKYDNVTPLIFYNFNVGTKDEVKDINAYKDYDLLLRKLFSLNSDIPKYIVIKSNGEYYASHVKLNLLFKEKELEKKKTQL